MSERTIYRVVHRDNQEDWAITSNVGSRPIATFENKEDAVDKARQLAKRQEPSQLVVQGMNGRIQFEHTYGQDPRKYPS